VPLQTRPSVAARAVPDVPGAITATRQTNAQVKARELVIILVNFVFIVIVSLSFWVSVVLAFFGFSLLSCYFRPFTMYLAGFGGSLRGKNRNSKNNGLYGYPG
jgi:hypothetical protein